MSEKYVYQTLTKPSLDNTIDDIQKAIEENEGEIYHRIIFKWKNMGLLEGLESPQKEECACCYEEMANYLICKFNPDTCDDEFETVVFPIIRRVIRKTGSFNGKFNPEFVEKFYYDNLEEAKKFVEEKTKIEPDFDREANICAYISDKLAEKVK